MLIRTRSQSRRSGNGRFRRQRWSSRLRVEALENRLLLSGIPVLLADLAPGGPDSHSDPSQFTEAGGNTYFVSRGKLWKTDGTEAGTMSLAEFASGPRVMTSVGGQLYFVADDGVHSHELWRSDGTEAGTTMVADINPDQYTPGPSFLKEFNGALYFGADDGVHGLELWRTDGTEAGTEMVVDINPGPASSTSLTHQTNAVFGGMLYITADDGVHGLELWKTDGTEAGTSMVADINPGAGHAQPWRFHDIGGTMLFWASDGVIGCELWKTDGTESGTELVKDINPGTGDSYHINTYSRIVFDGRLIFTADDGMHGQELWSSDGTPDGTDLVADINPGTDGSHGEFYTVMGDAVFFSANDATHSGLWKTSGTTAGTSLVAATNPPFNGPRFLTAGDTGLYFVASSSAYGNELWISNGFDTGTHVLFDINPGGDSNPGFVAFVRGKLFFSADDGVHGQEPWVYERGPLIVNGTAGDDVIVLRRNPADPGMLQVDFGDDGLAEVEIAAVAVLGVAVRTGAGNDTVLVDETDGVIRTGGLLGQAGHDTIHGTSFIDYIDGGSGDDLLFGYGDDDRIDGRAGNDTVDGGAGRDWWTFEGTPQDDFLDLDWDTLAAELVAHRRLSLAGAPVETDIASNVERPVLLGWGGHNRIDASALSVADILASPLQGTTLSGGLGNDTLLGSAGRDDLNGGYGNDLLHGGSGRDRLAGDEGDDTLIGSSGGDSLSGGDGNDLLLAGSGDDLIAAGEGDDTIHGGAGIDSWVFSGTAHDDFLDLDWDTLAAEWVANRRLSLAGVPVETDRAASVERPGLNGSQGHDRIDASAIDRADVLAARLDVVSLFGVGGNDTLLGSAARDDLNGGSGNDLLNGGAGRDTLAGNQGDDTLIGSSGHDILAGGDGNDLLLAGSGDDTVDGGQGDDTIHGGDGSDTIDGGDGTDGCIAGEVVSNCEA